MDALLHPIVVGVYLLAPPVALGLALWHAARRPESTAPLGILITFIVGLMLGIGGTLAYAGRVGGAVDNSQILLTTYFVTGLLFILKFGDVVLQWVVRPLTRRLGGEPVGFVIRAGALFVFALPLVLSALMVYRPRIQIARTPAGMGLYHESAQFVASDGVDLSAWWIPSQTPLASGVAPSPSNRTLVLCPGMGVSGASALPLAKPLAIGGYNVLLVEFRAHGDSGGRVTTFGDLERRDVLAAVSWARRTHPEAAEKIYGVGIDTGATALIGAAADRSDAGRAIEAVALVAPIGSFPEYAHGVVGDFLPRPLRWVVDKALLPLASVQSGGDLTHLRPMDRVAEIWPRPVLVIHGLRDRLVPFVQGEMLYDATARPRSHLWLLGDDHEQTVADPATAATILGFFHGAVAVPVI